MLNLYGSHIRLLFFWKISGISLGISLASFYLQNLVSIHFVHFTFSPLITGIYEVKPDIKAQRLIVEGVIEGEKLVKHVRGKLHKHAEIVTSKEIKKEEIKKEEKIEEKKKVEEVKTAVKVIGAEEVKEVQDKLKAANTPYIIHYVYAPQWFSDEDPNACSIM